MPRLTRAQIEKLGMLKNLGQEYLRWMSLWSRTIEELRAKGFGKITGPIKHIDIDKAMADKVGRRLVWLEGHFEQAKAETHLRIREMRLAAKQLGLTAEQIAFALNDRRGFKKSGEYDLRLYLTEPLPARIAERQLLDSIGKSGRRETEILWKYARQLKSQRKSKKPKLKRARRK